MTRILMGFGRTESKMETGVESGREAWKRFVRRHWKMTALFVGGIAAAAVAALLVFLWAVGNAQATGLVPSRLGEWTVGHVLAFVLNLILWELLLVASWAGALAATAYVLWYRKLPREERNEYERGRRRGRSAGEDSGMSFFIGLVWLVIVWIDGRWNTAFQAWTVDNWVFSWIAAVLVALAVVGIPGLIYVAWSLKSRAGTD